MHKRKTSLPFSKLFRGLILSICFLAASGVLSIGTAGASVVCAAGLPAVWTSGVLTAYAAEDDALSLSQEDVRVFDQAGLFTAQEAEELEHEIASMRSDMGMDIVLVTTDQAGGKTAKEYAEDFYIAGNFGTGDNYDGALFLIDMDNREIYLAPVGKMNRYLTDKRWNAILDDAYDRISEGDYKACADAFLNGVSRYYKAGIPSGQYNYDEETGKVSVYKSIRWYEALLAFLIAAGSAITPCMTVVSQYSMKKERRQADNYLMAYRADCKFQFASQKDDLINKTVTHIIIPRHQDNGPRNMGGGGSFSGRSTTHTTSGRSFGGGGRKF